MTEHKTMNTVAHAAFRRDLGRFDDALATFPPGSRERADQLTRAWAFFESEVHHHHDYEEQLHLRQVLLDHLEHEERHLEPLSAQYLSSAPMRAAAKQVVKAHRGRLGNVLAWLQDGADDAAKRFVRTEIPVPVVIVATTVAGRHYRRDVASVWR